MTRSARQVVEAYNLVVWNDRDLALARELFAETVIRHEVGEARTLTREQACQRVEDLWGLFETIEFALPVVVAGDDDEHVAIVYDSTMTTVEGVDHRIGSIEVFRVVDGQISEVWNCGYKEGRWA